MMKPWEETWLVTHGASGATMLEFALPEIGETVRFADVEDNDRARLASAAPDLVRALLAVEWAGTGDHGEPACVSCGQAAKVRHDVPDLEWDRASPHRPDCALDAALRKAGVR